MNFDVLAGIINLNQTQNTEQWIPCGMCQGQTCHKVMVSVDISVNVFSRYDRAYQIVQCQGCKNISFRESYLLFKREGMGIKEHTVNLYPSRVAGRHKLNQADLIPEELARIYNETHSALCNKQPVLAGIGIRALIETVCKEKVASGHNLEKKIDSLVVMGLLTSDGAEILHSLRILGNQAAHEVRPHSEETLGIAMDVVEHLLKGVYILPAAANKLPKRIPSGTP